MHELAHGWAALQLGDPTAKAAGRLTLNPLAHLDPIGTIALFLVGFGWAKPVPVNPRNFRSPIRDNALVALAGPASNFATAIAFGLALRAMVGSGVSGGPAEAAMTIFLFVTLFSIGLGMFNLIPVPPLDGSHILEAVLPPHARQTYNSIRPYAPFLLIILIFTGVFGMIIVGPMLFFFELITGISMG